MNKNIVTSALVALSFTACAGVKTRTSAEWRTDIGQSFASRSSDLKACYDGAGTKTKVALQLHLEATKHKDGNTVSVKNVSSADAAQPLVDCVKRVASTIVVSPEDKKNATGTWVVTFDPDVGVSTSAVETTQLPKG